MYYDVPGGLGLRKIAGIRQTLKPLAAGNRPRFTPEQRRQLSYGLAMDHELGHARPLSSGLAMDHELGHARPQLHNAAPEPMPTNSRGQTWRQNANAVIRSVAAPFNGIIKNAPNSVKSQIQGLAGNLGRLQRPQVLGTMVDNAMIDASTHIRPEDKQAVRNLREQQRRKWFKNGQYVGPKQGPYYDAARMANRTEPDVTGIF